MRSGASEWLFSIVKWTLAALAAALAAVVAINAFDESLHPEAQAFLQPVQRSIANERNGYFQLVGLSSRAADDAAHAAGVSYVAAIARAQARRIAGEPVQWPEAPGKPPAPARLCAFDGASCLAEVAMDGSAARRLVGEQQGLLARYRALLSFPEYLETYQLLHYEAPIVPFTPLLAAQRLFFVDAALRVRSGGAEAVAADLERAMAFSRRMLAGSTTLLGKMVAAAHARRTVQFSSELLASPAGAHAGRAARLAGALAPLADEERRLARVLPAEFRMQLSGLSDAGADLATRAAWFFLQRNATANRDYFSVYKPAVELDAAPPEQFDARRRALKERDLSVPAWSLVYNPIGKILSSNAFADWSSYIARMHDLEALMRLVALQAAIVSSGSAAGRIPQLAAVRERRYADPYTAQPMQWDASRRQLYFEPRSPGVLKGGGVPGRYAVTF